MPRAIWNGAVLAESDVYETVEGNVYFPRKTLKDEYFKPSTESSFCPWKGVASYYDIVVDGKTNAAAAWFYAEPKEEAAKIADHVAFWRGVEVKS